MSNNNNIIKTAFLLLSIWVLGACVEVDQPQPAEVGYLAALSLDVDVAVEDLAQTKALDFGIEAPSESEIHFVVKDKDGNVKYDADGLWVEPLVLPVGSYTVVAYAGENGFGAPYFKGSAAGSIGVLANEVPSLTMTLANSLVCVELDSEFAQHFDVGSSKAVLKAGSSSAEVAYGEWIYVPSGADLEVTMTGTTAGESVTLTHKLSSPSPKVAYNVICNKDSDNWPKITMNTIEVSNVWATRAYVTNGAMFSNMSATYQNAVVYEAIPSSSSDWSAPVSAVNDNGAVVFKGLTPGVTYQARARVGNIVSDNVVEFTPSVDGLSVSAAHTYTSSELDGTDVQTTFAKSELVKNAISSWTVKICKADGTVLRSETSLGNSDGSAITAVDGWPYLPVGDGQEYVVKASATVDGQIFSFADIALPVPATPDIILSLSAYTSYDKYAATNGIAKDLDGDTGANKCDASTLYNAGGKWGVSVNLMSNENYAKELVIDFDGDNSRTYSVTSFATNEFYENISGCSWTSHQLSVSFTFDKKTVTKTQTHHITGLPHRSSPPVSTATDSVNGWTKGNGNAHNWESSYLQFGVSGGEWEHTAYKDFHIPADINVSLASKIAAHNAPVNTTCSVLIGSTTVLSVDSDGGAFNYKTTEKEETVLTKMDSSSKRITLKNSYSVTSSWGRVYYINVLYR